MPIGIVILFIAIVFIIKKAKKNKKILYFSLVIVIIGIIRILLTRVISPTRSDYFGIILRKVDNYAIFFDGVNKFYLKIGNANIDVLDFIKISGSRGGYKFGNLESGFDFNNYLLNQGINEQIYAKNIVKIFDFPINPNSYKSYILAKIDDENVKNLVGGMIFGQFDYETSFGKQIRLLNLTLLFSMTGIYLNYVLFTLSKIFSYKLSDKKSDYLALVVFLPFLLFNITRFTTIKVVTFYIFRLINKYNLENYYSKLDRIAILGVIFVILDPFIVFQMEFYLSFLIMILFNYSYLFFKKYKRKKLVIMRYLFLFLITLPFTIKSTNIINIFNSITSYLLMIIFKPIFFILLSYFMNLNMNFLTSLLSYIVSFISKVNFSFLDINVPKFNSYFYILYYFIIILIFFFFEVNNKKYGNKIIGFLSILFVVYSLPINNLMTFEVDYINVGQGDSTLLRYQNTTILIDTGGLTYTDLATSNLIPFLKGKRIYKLDAVFITHHDYDHYGALDSLKENFTIKNVFYNDQFSTININNMEFKNLNTYGSLFEDENYKSLVLSYEFKNIKFLFMGDAPKEIEEKIILSNPNLRCDVLKVGHHGSNTSSSEDFIKTIKPKIAIISCGYNNKYHHPSDETLEVLEKYNIEIRRTDLEGTINYKFWV
ncbi:MAG: ComEC/Rec2 family competence protein [Bacilli bacterium]